MASPREGLLQPWRVFAKRPELKRLFRYGLVSVVSTIVSLVGLFLFFRVFKVGSAIRANLIATGIATLPSYYLNRTWAWGKSGRSHLMKEVVPFWTIAFLSMLLSTGAVGIAAHEAHHVTHSATGVTLLVEFANIFTYGVIWVGKFMLFNRLLFAAPKAAACEEPVPGATAVGPGASGAPGEVVADPVEVVAG